MVPGRSHVQRLRCLPGPRVPPYSCRHPRADRPTVRPYPKFTRSVIIKSEGRKGACRDNMRTEIATLAGGGFWGPEGVFDELEGGEGVVSGYSGGSVSHPTDN